MENKSYTDLNVWIEARKLVKNIYNSVKEFPSDEKFGLTQQIKKAAVSVPSNIAEGVGRNHSKDTIQFLFIAKGSLYELETQLYLSFDIGFLSKEILESHLEHITVIKKLLNGFINHKRKSIA